MNPIAFVVRVILIKICSGISISSDTLRFVHVVWRHGDRSPADGKFPNDFGNPEWSWPNGWGELTELGMRQHYALGSYLRKRYIDSGFLPKNYNASKIYIRSSDYNRTIMSALSNLAGMYPPSEDEKWMKTIGWQPIPVHTVPRQDDPMLWMDRPCPKAHNIYFGQVLISEEAKKVEKDYGNLWSFLREKTGHPIATLDDVRFIYDPLNCERIHNDSHKWPDWMNTSLFTDIQELHRISKTFSYHDPRLQRFRGSLLFWDIAHRSDQKAKNDPSLKPASLKYFAYSAHDSTMIALFENLGAYDGQVPPYASAVVFELHEKNGQFFIETLYINETGGETPVHVSVKGCDPSGCALDKFVEIARGQTPTDWYAECGFVKDEISNTKYRRVRVAVEILGTITALLFILLILSLAHIYTQKSQRITKVVA